MRNPCHNGFIDCIVDDDTHADDRCHRLGGKAVFDELLGHTYVVLGWGTWCRLYCERVGDGPFNAYQGMPILVDNAAEERLQVVRLEVV